MIYIEKGLEPASFAAARRSILNTPDATYSFSNLRGQYKRECLDSLLKEQGYLCAYCMCRIEGTDKSPATIEHLHPQHPEGELEESCDSLDYRNMVAVCEGRNGLTCDKRRKNTMLTVNPTVKATMETISYCRSGEIISSDDAIQFDLNEILGLNSSHTYLCHNRKMAMENVEKALVRSIKKRSINNNRAAKKRVCEKILLHYEMIASKNDGTKKDEYLGAKLFKAKKLVAKFSN